MSNMRFEWQPEPADEHEAEHQRLEREQFEAKLRRWGWRSYRPTGWRGEGIRDGDGKVYYLKDGYVSPRERKRVAQAGLATTDNMVFQDLEG